MMKNPIKSNSSFEDFKKWWSSSEIKSEVRQEFLYKDQTLLSQAMILNHSIIAVIDISKMEYLYMSPSISSLAGWDVADYLNEGVSFCFRNMHPDDHAGFPLTYQIMTTYFAQLPIAERPHYRAYSDYRSKKPDGKYIRALQQDYVLQSDEEGHIVVLLALCSLIHHYKSDDKLHLRVTNGKENCLYEFNIPENMLHSLVMLSQREMEIVTLINQGQNSEQVANRLCISKHTVDTHRRNMLEKLRANDTIELINTLKILGFL